jgi:exonuclease V gamma subunit
MSLSIFISNDINELANELCSKVELVNNNAFIPHQIVIQTRGMNQWLKYKIAEIPVLQQYSVCDSGRDHI